LRRSEREDTDDGYVADRIPKSFTPRAIARNWLQSHRVAKGRLRQERTEWRLALVPAEGEGWEFGGGSRRMEIDGTRVAADTLWLDGVALSSLH
jgi:hypothetical protein